MDTASTIISVLIGGGLLAFIQFLINRYDKKHDRMGDVLKAIQDVKNDVDSVKRDAQMQAAILSRTHILRFRDELYNDMKHTSEYFEQTLDDIQVYDQYCEKNPKFANGRTKAAAEFIREEYKRLFKEHKL